MNINERPSVAIQSCYQMGGCYDRVLTYFNFAIYLLQRHFVEFRNWANYIAKSGFESPVKYCRLQKQNRLDGDCCHVTDI